MSRRLQCRPDRDAFVPSGGKCWLIYSIQAPAEFIRSPHLTVATGTTRTVIYDCCNLDSSLTKQVDQ
jgi:hypothetical protein